MKYACLPKSITVLHFASTKDATGRRKESLNLSKDYAIRDLLLKVLSAHPKISDILNTMQISVNYKVADRNTILMKDDKVALLSPVSG